MKHLLLGRDHGHFGALHVETLAEGLAAAISAGADALSPSMRFKGSRGHGQDFSNEDGLLAVIEGDRVGLAVADAHFGHAASQLLLEALAHDVDLASPEAWLAAAARHLDGDPTNPSETTLLVVTLDRSTGRGQGISFGDSSCVRVGRHSAEWQNRKDDKYLHPSHPDDLTTGDPFEVVVVPGDLLLLFTDGIDECHYQHPRTSVGMKDFVELYGDNPFLYARRLAARALNGVDGHPGGQDNLALLVLRA